jgi:pyruvate formate lyase activating enzyme
MRIEKERKLEEQAVLMKYLVFDVQRFSYHDGPGIRTSVFLKGCSLSCQWCQNPESQKKSPELMYFEQTCLHCGTCVQACPAGALAIDAAGGQLNIDRRACTLCGLCEQVCPTGALRISGRYMTAGEILDIVEEDAEFFRLSGGGLTLTGGEPLLHGGVAELLGSARHRGLHTAVETAGYVPTPALLEAARYTDLFLFDMKVWDERRHQEFCGQSNRLIKENLLALKEAGAHVQVRIPVVPTVNDTEEELGNIVRFVKAAGFDPPELLMFNKLGAFKYMALGRQYEVQEIQIFDQNEWKRCKGIAKRAYEDS